MQGSSIFQLVLVVIILNNVNKSLQNDSSAILRGATIIFRHGDRNPIQSYPGDPFKNETIYWPEGYGAMTTAGKVRLYNLGWYMRKRYPTFQRKNVVVYTSDQNRTITSAMANLAGFYGQNRSFLKHVDSFNPRGLGIKVVPTIEDDFILIRKPCPKYDQLRQEYLNETRPMEKYKDAVDIIYQNTGLNFSTFTIDVVLFADTILVQKSRNLQLPQWIEDLHKDDVFYEIRDEYFAHMMPTFELKRLRTGSMIKRFLKEADQVVNAVFAVQKTKTVLTHIPIPSQKILEATQTDFPKITIISGHDSTIVNWMIDLNIYDLVASPPYGAAIFMELYEEVTKLNNTVFSIKVFYKNYSENDPVQMHLPGCPSPCHYKDFKKMLEPLVMINRQEACQIANEEEMSVHLSDTQNSGEQPSKSNSCTTRCDNCSWILINGSFSLIIVLFRRFSNN